jgi:hypothetical protein
MASELRIAGGLRPRSTHHPPQPPRAIDAAHWSANAGCRGYSTPRHVHHQSALSSPHPGPPWRAAQHPADLSPIPDIAQHSTYTSTDENIAATTRTGRHSFASVQPTEQQTLHRRLQDPNPAQHRSDRRWPDGPHHGMVPNTGAAQGQDHHLRCREKAGRLDRHGQGRSRDTGRQERHCTL